MSVTIAKIRHKSFDTLDICLALFLSLFIVCAFMFVSNPVAYGGNFGDNLTDLFQTRTFRGSAEALSGANWIGTIMHYVISLFSFLGLCLTLYQKFITLLYLSARTLFDQVYDIKVNKMKGGILGYKGILEIFKSGENGNQGGGFDVIITFFYSLLPNIKAYSDYCPDKLRDRLDENDGVVTYMLKTSIPTIMLIFFLTIGYSGTLPKAYGVVVDGMATAADNLVTKNLSGWVNRLVSAGDAYQFTLSGIGTPGGEFAEKVAREMYAGILAKCGNTTEEFRFALGKVIENTVYGDPNIQPMIVPAYTPSGNGILGGLRDGVTDNGTAGQLLDLVRARSSDVSSASEGSTHAVSQLLDQDIKNLKARMYMVGNKEVLGGAGLSYDVFEIVTAATANSPDAVMTRRNASERYLHIMVEYNISVSSDFLQQIGSEGMTYD